MSTYTRKTFVAVADILSDFKTGMPNNIFDELVTEFADMFADDNQNFNYAKFVEACNG